MTFYVYHWDLRVTRELRLELQIEAASAAAARREVSGFLLKHGGADWWVEGVRRGRVVMTPRADADLRKDIGRTLPTWLAARIVGEG